MKKKNFCADDINAHLRGKITFIMYGQNSKLQIISNLMSRTGSWEWEPNREFNNIYNTDKLSKLNLLQKNDLITYSRKTFSSHDANF